MSQSKVMSLLESNANMVSGFILSWMMWTYMIAPVFGHDTDLHQGFLITAVFTLTSVARSYTLRRIFNNIEVTK